MLKKQLFTHASWLRMHWFKAMRAFAAVPLICNPSRHTEPLGTCRPRAGLCCTKPMSIRRQMQCRTAVGANTVLRQPRCEEGDPWRELPLARLEHKSTAKTFGHARADYR